MTEKEVVTFLSCLNKFIDYLPIFNTACRLTVRFCTGHKQSVLT